MGDLEYYASRDDGTTWGPFPDSQSGLFFCVHELADDPDDTTGFFTKPAIELVSWWQSMQSRQIEFTSVEMSAWIEASIKLVKAIDWIVYGFEGVGSAHITDIIGHDNLRLVEPTPTQSLNLRPDGTIEVVHA